MSDQENNERPNYKATIALVLVGAVSVGAFIYSYFKKPKSKDELDVEGANTDVTIVDDSEDDQSDKNPTLKHLLESLDLLIKYHEAAVLYAADYIARYKKLSASEKKELDFSILLSDLDNSPFHEPFRQNGIFKRRIAKELAANQDHPEVVKKCENILLQEKSLRSLSSGDTSSDLSIDDTKNVLEYIAIESRQYITKYSNLCKEPVLLELAITIWFNIKLPEKFSCNTNDLEFAEEKHQERLKNDEAYLRAIWDINSHRMLLTGEEPPVV